MSGRVLQLFRESNTIVELSPSFASAQLDDLFDPLDQPPGDVICSSFSRGIIQGDMTNKRLLTHGSSNPIPSTHYRSNSERTEADIISSSTVLILVAAQERMAATDLILLTSSLN